MGQPAEKMLVQLTTEELTQLVRDTIREELRAAQAANGNGVSDVLDIEEAARHLRVSRRTITNLIIKKDLPHERVGRALRFSRSRLDAWKEEQGKR